MARTGSAGYFTHFQLHRDGAAEEPVELPDATRYMCAAAYLDRHFADAVIAELAEDEHRAVAPAVGYDVEPVLRHCVQARQLRLYRDIGLLAVLAVGGLLAPGFVALWLMVGAVVAAVRWLRSVLRRRRERRLVAGRRRVRAVPIILTIVALYLVCSCGFAGLAAMLRLQDALGGGSGGGYLPAPVPGEAALPVQDSGGYGGLLLRIGVVLILALGVLFWYKRTVYRVLTVDLGRGNTEHVAPDVPYRGLRERVEQVAAAQYGNIALHSGRNPFIGAGPVQNSWSMSLDLRPTGKGSHRGERIPIDPVALHQHVRQRLREMYGETLRDEEKITGLVLSDHVVGAGEREHDELIEPRHLRPYSVANREAIDAIIRQPQGRLRHYLRAVVGSEGREIMSPDGRTVASRQDQQIAVSTFLYLAVEGGMLYAEFVACVMPPLRTEYLVIDRWVPETLTVRAFGEALRAMFTEVVAAPYGLTRSLATIAGYSGRMRRADRASRQYRYYDYGARISIRELAALAEPDSYLQALDAEKYYKLVERAITGAILDFLADQKVDTTEYETRANAVLNAGVIITGGTFAGPVAAGAGAVATQA
ncbi:hypothetical protein [Dactylosporangium sp. NPDC048998]|uniref:hypothetical protein n=1 Tax=Dactylosporangium sp. NPDC048998 TaxID=3363976 RepID=UPI0037114EFE